MGMHATLAEWIIQETEEETIEAVVIGWEENWSDDSFKERIPNFEKMPKNTVMTWEKALPFLQYKFYTGYGGADCLATYAWTKNWVFFVSEYDGSTSLRKVPRNPTNCVPELM